MSNALQLRRGTTAEHATFTGAQSEVTVDTTKNALVVHDGATAGGHPVLPAAVAVEKTSDTGALIVPEGTDAQRPAAGGLRASTQSATDYFAEIKNKVTNAWDALASRLWSAAVFAQKNHVVNGGFQINQRNYSSGAATTAGQYVFDQWAVTGTGGVTFSTSANKTTVTIPSGQTLKQIVEGVFLESAKHVLTWEGTAQARFGSGSYGASGISADIVGGTNTTIEFNSGTVSNVRLTLGFASPLARLPDPVEELKRCRRYFRTTYVGVSAGTVTTTGAAVGGTYYNTSSESPSGIGCIFVDFGSELMRAAPTVVVRSPNSGTAGFVFDSGERAATVRGQSVRGFHATYLGNGGVIGIAHYTAEASLT